MSVAVRAAGAADADALLALNQVIQDLHAALYPGDFKQVADPSLVKAFFMARLGDPKIAIGIAEIDGAPAGYVLFEIQERPETAFNPARARLYVHHVCVAKEVRRRGVGAALIRYVEERAAMEGIDTVALDVWATNSDAQRFFAAQGFAAFNASLRKKLPRIGKDL